MIDPRSQLARRRPAATHLSAGLAADRALPPGPLPAGYEMAGRIAVPTDIREQRPARGASAKHRVTMAHPNRRPQALSQGSADADTLPDLRQVRALSQALMRNVPAYRRMVLARLRQLAHQAYRVIPSPDAEFIRVPSGDGQSMRKLTKEEVAAFVKSARHEWRLFCRQPEATGRHSWFAMVWLMAKSYLTDGDSFAVRIIREDDLQPRVLRGRRFANRWQLVEAGQVAEGRAALAGVAPGNTLAGGIELSPHGEPVALHVHARHPGDPYRPINARGGASALGRAYGADGAYDVVRIPWRDRHGRPMVLHLFDPDRIGQTRGFPFASAAMGMAMDTGEFIDAALIRAQISSALAGYITKNPENMADGSGNPTIIGAAIAGTDEATSTVREYILNGSVRELEVGESITWSDPPAVGDHLDEDAERLAVEMAGAIGESYETLSGDFRRTTYSSARAALEFVEMTVRAGREMIKDCLADPAYRVMLEEAVLQGRVRVPGVDVSDPDFVDDLDADCFAGFGDEWMSADWITPAMPRIDQEKELKAEVLKLANGLTTYARVAAKYGEDFATVTAALADEIELRRGLGVHGVAIADTTPGSMSDPGSNNQSNTGGGGENTDDDGDPDREEREEIDKNRRRSEHGAGEAVPTPAARSRGVRAGGRLGALLEEGATT